MPYLSSN